MRCFSGRTGRRAPLLGNEMTRYGQIQRQNAALDGHYQFTSYRG